MGMWVIWSEEHGAWWAPFERGYVRSLALAGRYTKLRAAVIMQTENAHLPPPGFREIAFPDPLEIYKRVVEERAGNPNLQTPK